MTVRPDVPNVVVVDTGIANFGSIESAIARVGGASRIGREKRDFENATHVIVPGVGSFDFAIRMINERDLLEALCRKVLLEKTPALGICLGMQLFGATSAEGRLPGFGWFNGCTVRLNDADVRVPHIGWNKVSWRRSHALFDGIDTGERFYFVHSYHYTTPMMDEVVASVAYGDEIVAAVQRDNIFGVQFHPEKSLAGGLTLLRNFLRMSR